MEEETITFELVRKIQREERDSPSLVKLPENFFEKVKNYLDQKRKLLEKKEDRKVALEVKNVERLVENIFDRRERKILNQALITVRTQIPPQNLTEEEKEFFEKVVEILKERRKKFFEKIFGRGEGKKKVRFKADVPEFVGIDGEVYGPFKEGEEAEIPPENARVLTQKGLAEEV
ncbi:MAG TPA: DNA replication complex GINS family protein [Candidatus Aenigmarchaeota archaeon]|nr:DNA replication complex GINS family protein [Candidatus Aenigmarchaeota archaeon]